MQTYTTKGTCARAIDFSVSDGRVHGVKFHGGCPGGGQGVARLVEGLPATEVVERLKGIICRNNTSCPDQLATALQEYLSCSEDGIDMQEQAERSSVIPVL